MNITSGLFKHMVLQRTRKNVCDVAISGETAADGIVVARVTMRGSAVKGFSVRVIGRARGGRLAGRLRGLPVGGPYDIELAVRAADGQPSESLCIRNVFVGDVWLLGGQSNMQGIGRTAGALKPNSNVRAFYMNDEWAVARDPIHNLNEAVDIVHGWVGPERPRKRSGLVPPTGVGPGVPFGLAMWQRTRVPQGLIACAHGGTSMTQWDPALKKMGSKSLYGAMCRRFNKNGARVAGVLWYQGESDANEKAAELFIPRMRRLIRAMRRDFGNRTLPFVMAQLARVVNRSRNEQPTWWNSIQEAQRILSKLVKHCATVPAIDLPLDDGIHVSGEGMRRLGPRLAQAMSMLRRDKGAGLPPIALKNVRFHKDPIFGCYEALVQYEHVAGRLISRGEPSGFTLIDQAYDNAICRVSLRGNAVLLRILSLDRNYALHYGYGFAPVCNITDEADRSLPVFGPLEIAAILTRQFIKKMRQQKAPVFDIIGVTPFAERVWISRPLPAPRRLKELAYPANQADLKFKERAFPGVMWDLHLDVFDCAPCNIMVFFKSVIKCPEAMKLDLGIGYDGPVKIWLNRRAVFCDPKGTNPAGNEKAVIPFNAPKGRHEVIFALTSNHGAAWGIKFRCHRRDLTKKQLVNPSSFRMPVLTV